MSRGFVKEYEDQWLNDIAPTMTALTAYLARENSGMRIIEEKTYFLAGGREAHVMSNGLTYAVNDDRQWYVVLDY